jgi:hypothetical protein
VLFVVPGPSRIETLRRAYDALAPKRERHRQDSYLVNLDGRWPMLATTTTALHDAGPLSRVWESIADPTQPPLALGELPSTTLWDEPIWPARSGVAGATSNPASGIDSPRCTATRKTTTAARLAT